MRFAVAMRALVPVAFFAFAAVAYLDPSLFAFAHARSAQGTYWLVLSALATGCAAKLTLPLSLLGWNVRLSAPLFLALAAPYLLRLLFWREAGRRLAGVLSATPASTRELTPAAPFALAGRVAVALQAAARARR